MFLIKDGKKVWDKTQIYGYSDAVIRYSKPFDNTNPIKGCGETLTVDEIYKLFPNQLLLLELVGPKYNISIDRRARVLYIHGNIGYFTELIHQNSYPRNWIIFATYSGIVISSLECFRLFMKKGVSLCS